MKLGSTYIHVLKSRNSDNENAKDEQSGANEESANHQIRETEEILLEIFKPDKDGDS
jgi:hypothetical protein